jgi:hypothetical protein
MKWQSTKSSDQVSLAGVKVEFVKEDASITELIIRDSRGGVIRVKKGEAYSSNINVLVPAPPEKKKVFVLAGRFQDVVDIRETFGSDSDARDRLRELQRAGGVSDLKVEPEEIEVTEPIVAATPALEEIPF